MHNPQNYHDVTLIIETCGGEIYRDFEGLVDATRAFNACRDEAGQYVWDIVMATAPDEGLSQVVRDITLNLVSEQLGYGGRTPPFTEVVQICSTIYEMLTCKLWLKTNLGPLLEASTGVAH